MSHDVSVHVTDHLRSFIEREVARGRFSTAEEVLEAALLLLEERENRLFKLRAQIAQEERSHERG